MNFSSNKSHNQQLYDPYDYTQLESPLIEPSQSSNVNMYEETYESEDNSDCNCNNLTQETNWDLDEMENYNIEESGFESEADNNYLKYDIGANETEDYSESDFNSEDFYEQDFIYDEEKLENPESEYDNFDEVDTDDFYEEDFIYDDEEFEDPDGEFDSFDEQESDGFYNEDFIYNEEESEDPDSAYDSIKEANYEDFNKAIYSSNNEIELENEFESILDKLKGIFSNLKNKTKQNQLPDRAPDGRKLLLPIVSIPLPDSPNYTIYSKTRNRHFGIPETIEALKWIGDNWSLLHSNIDFRIGDISQLGGGRISGHASHRMGIDVDVKLYLNGNRIDSSFSNYDANRKYVRDFITIVSKNPYLKIHVIGWQDNSLKSEFKGKVNIGLWKGHSNHLHLRFCLPSKRILDSDIKKVYSTGKIGSYRSCKESEVNYLSNFKTLDTSMISPSFDINSAIKYNNLKRNSLGWGKYLSNINVHLGLPAKNSSEEKFARAVARWQKKEGFKEKDIDGKIGPNTWRELSLQMGLDINLTSFSKNIINQTIDFQNLGMGIDVPKDKNNFRKFRLTTYHVVDQKEYPTGNIKIPIYDIRKDIISYGSPKFFAKLSLEGTAKLSDGRLINVTGKTVTADHHVFKHVLDYHIHAYSKSNRRRIASGRKPVSTKYSGIVLRNNKITRAFAFHVVSKSKIGVGYGTQRGISYVPFRTLAADIGTLKYGKVEKKWKGKGGVIPPGTKVYIKEYDGLVLPDNTVHDGWFIVNDTGGAIYGAHLDVFVGSRKLRSLIKLPNYGHIWFEGIERRVPTNYTYGLNP